MPLGTPQKATHQIVATCQTSKMATKIVHNTEWFLTYLLAKVDTLATTFAAILDFWNVDTFEILLKGVIKGHSLRPYK